MEQFQAMASLSGMLAHELKTPLTSAKLTAINFKDSLAELLKGYAFYAENCKEAATLSSSKLEKLGKALEHMDVSLGYALTTIRSILTGFHTTVSDEVTIHSFDVGALIREAIQDYPISEAERAHITVRAVQEGPVLQGLGDTNRVTHVLHNLLKNALQAIKEAGKGHITISYKKREDQIMIEFEDTALGIEAEALNQVFVPFYTTKKKSAFSIGMGLYFCKLAMEKMCGSISCVSEKGVYTRFTICLPSAEPV